MLGAAIGILAIIPFSLACSDGNLHYDIVALSLQHSNAERLPRLQYSQLATAPQKIRNDLKGKYDWPFPPLSIGHSTASYQNYGGNPYFHHGLDVRGNAGTSIYASAGGQVVNIENYMPNDPAYWEVAILDDEGYLWQYHHIDRSSIPASVWDAFRKKEKVPAGTKLGEIYYWPVVSMGERFHHLHLNVLASGGSYVNPFNFLKALNDSSAPVIEEIGILKNKRRHSSNSVKGTYSLYAKVHDLILHDRFVVPAHELQIRVDNTPFDTVWNFDTLPGGNSNTAHVKDFFVESMTCGNYSCRSLVVDLGFALPKNRSFPWNEGLHRIELVARDAAGNESSEVFTWRLEIDD
jgi:hypothetical protein